MSDTTEKTIDRLSSSDGTDVEGNAPYKFMEFLDSAGMVSLVGSGASLGNMFVLCDRGEATFRVNLRELTVRKGQFCLIIFKKDVRFVFRSSDFKARFVLVSDEAMEYRRRISRIDTAPIALLGYLHECPTVTLNRTEYAVLDQYFGLLESRLSECDRPMYRQIVVSILQALFLDTFQIYHRSYEAEGAENMNTSRNEAVFIEFMGLVHQYHRKARNVGFYAERLYITPKYLSSVVKQVSGRSAKEIIDDYVISEAKVLLAKPRMNVQQVAFEFNFASQTFFGKYFKRHTGVSPGDYKNTVK